MSVPSIAWVIATILFSLWNIVSATAQSPATSAWRNCRETSAVDRRISGCSTVLARGYARSADRRSLAYLIRATAYYEKRDFTRTVADTGRAIRLMPKNYTAHFLRGLVYRDQGKTDEALKDFAAVLRQDPKNAPTFLSRGLLYANKGDHDRAIADYDSAIKFNPKDAMTFRNRGASYLAKTMIDRAVADFDEAIRLNPKIAVTFNDRGLAYLNKGELDRAASDFDEAIRLEPKLAMAWFNRGLLYLNKGEFTRAIEDTDESIRLNPEFAIALNNRGWAYHNKGEFDRAIADYDEAVRLDPNFSMAYTNRGLAHATAGRFARAQEDFGNAVRIDPQNIAAYFHQASTFVAEGRHDEAIAAYTKVLAIDPKQAETLGRRGDAHSARGDHRMALADYGAALEIDPNLLIATEGRKRATAALERMQPVAQRSEGDVTAEDQRRVALVIGIDSYRNIEPLRTARNDARSIAKALEQLGFEVALAENPDRAAMADQLAGIEQQVGAGDTVVFHFSGQGLSTGARNYLLPSDMPMIGVGMEALLEETAFAADTIMQRLNARGARTAFLVLDACRSNPFQRADGGSAPFAGARGCKRMTPPRGAFVLLPADPGESALERLDDGDTHPNSVFGRIFAEEIARPGARLADVALATQERVNVLARTTGKDQLPAFYDGYVGRFALK